MIDEKKAKKYCKEDISLIENYDEAVADTTQTWHMHHRRETDEGLSARELIKKKEYLQRPACELIFLTGSEHRRLHNRGEKNPYFGKHHSEETKKKMSEAKIGTHHSEEHKKKISQALSGEKNPNFGKHFSEETKKKLSFAMSGEKNPLFGKHRSEETKQKIAESKLGKHWYNNGIKNIFAKTCPEGFVEGRLQRKKMEK